MATLIKRVTTLAGFHTTCILLGLSVSLVITSVFTHCDVTGNVTVLQWKYNNERVVISWDSITLLEY